MDYAQWSTFGKFWPAGGNSGISFKLRTCEIQDFDLISMFRDPILFDENNNLVVSKVNTIINDESFSSDSATPDNRSIKIIKIYRTESAITVTPEFEKGNFIVMEGEIEYKTVGAEVKGSFTLMLVEFK